MLIGWAVSAIFSSSLMAIDCNSTDISITNQDQIENFEANYGPCDRILGDLTVEGSDIVQLDGLSTLVSVVGTLNIKNNPELRNISGLSNLESVGGDLFVENNGTLNDLDGLARLANVGQGLYVFRNESLDQVNGLESLTTVGHNFYISDNPSLENLDGLPALERVGNRLRFYSNDNLANIDGFSGLTEIGLGLEIEDNPSLVNVTGFASLESPLSDLSIQRNDSLVSIGGLSRLEWAESLLISRNSSLVDLQGLATLQKTGSLTVKENSALRDLHGLSSIREAYSVSLVDNVNLNDCQALVTLIDPIDDYEPGPGPGASDIPDVADEVTIHSNLAGCNSVNEILGQVPLHEMNAGLSDAWFDLETNGQGFLIIVFSEIQQVFMAWFTYDTERPPDDVTASLGEPGHRWLTAQGEYQENVAEQILYLTTGGVFDSEEPTTGTEPYGEILLGFSTCNSGTVTYDIPSIDRHGVVPIERITLDNVSLCYLLNFEVEK